jgi:hypothetical protein
MVGFTFFGPLKNGMLNKMGHPMFMFLLVTRTGIDYQSAMTNR